MTKLELPNGIAGGGEVRGACGSGAAKTVSSGAFAPMPSM